MRIALLSTFSERCGIATYAESLRGALIARGNDVTVIAPKLRKGDCGLRQQPMRLWNRNRAFGFEALRVHRELVALKPEVVHLQVNLSLFSSRFAFNLAALCAMAHLPMVVTLHGRKSGSWGPDFKWARLRYAFRRADLIVHTESHRTELARDRVAVVPHGMDAVQIGGDRARARAALNIPEDARVLTHFGFLVPDKGIEEVLQAIARLRDAGQRNIFYNVCGAVYCSLQSHGYFAKLSRAVEQLNLRDNVRLTGEFVDDQRMMLEMHASDWIVLNYRTGNGQGASGAVRRALSSGTAVAVSDAPVFDDVRDAVHTMRGPLPDAIADMLRDVHLAEATQQKARSFCEQHSWARIAEQHEAIYRAAVERALPRKLLAPAPPLTSLRNQGE